MVEPVRCFDCNAREAVVLNREADGSLVSAYCRTCAQKPREETGEPNVIVGGTGTVMRFYRGYYRSELP
jgi:hypothetical protein